MINNLLLRNLENGITDTKTTDEEVVSLTLENQKYFSLLVKKYERPLGRYIVRIVPSLRDSVPDILQEVFMNAYAHLNDFDQKLKFSSWIYKITHNYTISTLRKVKSRPQTVSADIEKCRAFTHSFIDVNSDKMEALYAKEEVESILGLLDLESRKILRLYFLEEKRYQEISKILNKPVGTVGVLVCRAKKKFKEKYILKYGNENYYESLPSQNNSIVLIA